MIKLISVCWNIASRCNYNCGFCFRINNKRELYFNEAKIVLQKLSRSGIKKISFSGGEPMLWPGIFNLIALAKQLDIYTMLITNGSLLNINRIKSLEKILDWITLPLDGSNEEIQRMAGRPKGHFTHIMGLLERLKKSTIKIKINTVLSNCNINDLENISKIINKFPIKRWKIFQFFPIRSNALKNKNKYFINSNLFNEFVEKIKNYFQNKQCLVYFGSNNELENSYFSIAPDGTVYVSKKNSDLFIGDLMKEDVTEIWKRASLINKQKYWERASWFLHNK